LIAAADLDESITLAIRERRAKVTEGEATQQKLSALLELLALAAVVVTWRLGHRVRTYAITAEERRAALAEATASRARFMRGVSHDLKNPIHAIDGHAQLLEMGLRGPLTPEQQDSIARIRRSVQSLTRLIEDLLDLARAESGQLPIALERVVLHDLVHETVEEHRAAAEAAHLELVYASDGADIGLVSDPARVCQVLGNLLSNAIKYTPANGRIDVSVARVESPGPNLSGPAMAIYVDDDGPGIPPDRREEIFAEFTRLRPDVGPGAGLGLSIARRIARMLGGDVTVDERIDKGSRFTLWLPIDSAIRRSQVGERAQQARVRWLTEVQPVPRDIEPAVVDESTHALNELLHESPAGKHV
jgi:signal transduction histidine kinase